METAVQNMCSHRGLVASNIITCQMKSHNVSCMFKSAMHLWWVGSVLEFGVCNLLFMTTEGGWNNKLWVEMFSLCWHYETVLNILSVLSVWWCWCSVLAPPMGEQCVCRLQSSILAPSGGLRGSCPQSPSQSCFSFKNFRHQNNVYNKKNKQTWRIKSRFGVLPPSYLPGNFTSCPGYCHSERRCYLEEERKESDGVVYQCTLDSWQRKINHPLM